MSTVKKKSYVSVFFLNRLRTLNFKSDDATPDTSCIKRFQIILDRVSRRLFRICKENNAKVLFWSDIREHQSSSTRYVNFKMERIRGVLLNDLVIYSIVRTPGMFIFS